MTEKIANEHFKTKIIAFDGVGIEIFVVNDRDYTDRQLIDDVQQDREVNPHHSVWRLTELEPFMSTDPTPDEFRKLHLIKKTFCGRIVDTGKKPF